MQLAKVTTARTSAATRPKDNRTVRMLFRANKYARRHSGVAVPGFVTRAPHTTPDFQPFLDARKPSSVSSPYAKNLSSKIPTDVRQSRRSTERVPCGAAMLETEPGGPGLAWRRWIPLKAESRTTSPPPYSGQAKPKNGSDCIASTISRRHFGPGLASCAHTTQNCSGPDSTQRFSSVLIAAPQPRLLSSLRSSTPVGKFRESAWTFFCSDPLSITVILKGTPWL